MGECDTDDSPQPVFSGLQLLLYTCLVPIAATLFGFAFRHIYDNSRLPIALRILCLSHITFVSLYVCTNWFSYTIARASELQLYPAYCHIHALITWNCGVFWNLSMELFWFERLKLTYQHTPYFINVYAKYGVYIVCILVTTWVMTFALIITINSDCAMPLRAIDFNPFGDEHSVYVCGGYKPWIEYAYLGTGGVGVFMLSSLLGYMYLSRLIRMANEHRRGEYFDVKTYKAIQRATIIAVTSTTSNVLAIVIAFVLVGTLEAGYILLPLDGLLNGVCMLCSFQIGNQIYARLFGCCRRLCPVPGGRAPEIPLTETQSDSPEAKEDRLVHGTGDRAP